jgi:hypothetical protein
MNKFWKWTLSGLGYLVFGSIIITGIQSILFVDGIEAQTEIIIKQQTEITQLRSKIVTLESRLYIKAEIDSNKVRRHKMTNPNSLKIVEAEKRFQSKTDAEIKQSPLRSIK